MRLYHQFTFLALIPLLACTKPNYETHQPDELEGSWVMVKVKDHSSSMVSTKPNSVSRDVTVTFSPTSDSSGTIAGSTPSNIIESNYVTGQDSYIRIPNLAMTQAIETDWGNNFVDNITEAKSYGFEDNGQLVIETKRKTLTFLKK